MLLCCMNELKLRVKSTTEKNIWKKISNSWKTFPLGEVEEWTKESTPVYAHHARDAS